MINYSVPYLILCSVLILLSMIQIFTPLCVKNIKYLTMFAVALMLLFFGFRGLIGWDWYNYYPYFEHINISSPPKINLTHNETGFYLYVYLIKILNPNYQFFVFVSVLIDLVLLYRVINRYVDPKFHIFSLILFLGMEGLIYEVNLMRGIKALLIFLLALRYITERKWLLYYTMCFFSLLFHWSSIIFFPLYFFLHRRIDIRIYFLIIVIGNMLFLLNIEYIKPILLNISHFLTPTAESKTNIYLSSNLYSKNYSITFGYLERIFTSLVVLGNYSYLTNNSKRTLFVNSFLIYIIFYLYFSEISIVLIRLGNLFIFSYWIIWPLLFQKFESSLKFSLFLVLSLYMILKTYKATNNILYEYDNSLFNSISYKQRVHTFEVYSPKLKM